MNSSRRHNGVVGYSLAFIKRGITPILTKNGNRGELKSFVALPLKVRESNSRPPTRTENSIEGQTKQEGHKMQRIRTLFTGDINTGC